MPSFPNKPDGCISIDGGHSDPAMTFLADSENYLSGKGFGKHTTTEMAISNALAQLRQGGSGRTVDLIGHGTPGQIFTGCGDRSIDRVTDANHVRNTDVGVAGPAVWEAFFRKLKGQADVVRLWGCQVGATPNGVELLQQIFSYSHATVMAPAVFIQWSTAGDIINHDGGPMRWQYVNADQPTPEPVSLPLFPDRAPVASLQLPGSLLEIAHITGARITSVQPHLAVPIDQLGAKALVASLGIQGFPEAGGSPAAVKTHQVTISVDDGRTASLGIYNDQYVFPSDAPSRFVIVSRQFVQALSQVLAQA